MIEKNLRSGLADANNVKNYLSFSPRLSYDNTLIFNANNCYLDAAPIPNIGTGNNTWMYSGFSRNTTEAERTCSGQATYCVPVYCGKSIDTKFRVIDYDKEQTAGIGSRASHIVRPKAGEIIISGKF